MTIQDPLKELFSDDAYCRQEIVRIRNEWGTHPVDWEAVMKALGFMLLNCSEEMAPIVRAHLLEGTRRRAMMGEL